MIIAISFQKFAIFPGLVHRFANFSGFDFCEAKTRSSEFHKTKQILKTIRVEIPTFFKNKPSIRLEIPGFFRKKPVLTSLTHFLTQ